MDSLAIQDVFEPYYAGRDRAAAPKDKRTASKVDCSPIRPAAGALPTNVTLSDNEPDSTTEH
ncbi:hypothetical protein [Mesorhizobium sp. ES1-1]|uniref:hypothetical protein n=1 Tax=Mesorhizobium sp. ES1-1 TaxID=2876629 RepID=UPI001CCB34EB|nr:hypothetical protein [Mesorhizobium sp. ES1-1]MBZ9675198.1 hypothetical protein [Mesorhizobium sp. ES1-1]